MPHHVSGTALGPGDTAGNRADTGPALLGFCSKSVQTTNRIIKEMVSQMVIGAKGQLKEATGKTVMRRVLFDMGW